MFTLTLNEKEIDLLKKSINHCLKPVRMVALKRGVPTVQLLKAY